MDDDKVEVWSSVEDRVREIWKLVPQDIKKDFKLLSEKHFPGLVTELQNIKAKFQLETSLQECRRLGNRYVHLSRALMKNIQLQKLGASKFFEYENDWMDA